jgi:hypothetical protein
MRQFKKLVNDKYQAFKFVSETDTEIMSYKERFILENKNTFDIIIQEFSFDRFKQALRELNLSLPRGKWIKQGIW